jgi:hypothetical protein
MTVAMKIGVGIVAVAMATTTLLPNRQTVPVLGALFGGLSQWTGTAMGTK